MKTRKRLYVILAVAAIAGALLFVLTPRGSSKFPVVAKYLQKVPTAMGLNDSPKSSFPEVTKYLQEVPTAKGWRLAREQSFAPSRSTNGNVVERTIEDFRKPDLKLARVHYLYDANGTNITVIAYHDGESMQRIDIVSYIGSSCPPMEELRNDLKHQFPGIPCRVVSRYKP
jgi:hypothetical protein